MVSKNSQQKNGPYDHSKIEKKWQKYWQLKKIYKTKDPGPAPAKASDGRSKGKFYVLDMFPYPSGEGLHVGHPKGYIATDVVSRMKRMQGYNVLHPMGFDAFGLPAEQYAIKMKTNPALSVSKNVEHYKKQLEIIGFDYDWSREVVTTDPKFYKWTQWIFLKMFEKGLAYEAYEPINWCPVDKTGLANEDVENGRCERCGALVEKKLMKQWMLRITDYAERLLADLDAVESDIPLMISKRSDDYVRPNLPDVEREAAVCILKHWKEDKYLCSQYKINDWHGFVIGGIEKGEDPMIAAVREVREETGYQNIKAVRVLGQVDSKFYHQIKKHNRFAHFIGVYAELTDDSRKEMSEEEKALHDVVWIEGKEVRKFLNRDDMRYIWDLFTGAETQKGMRPLLDWPESIKESQRNWIGKSEGAEIEFKIISQQVPEGFSPASPRPTPAKNLPVLVVKVFTTRPDTLFGATYLVLAPEHKFIEENKDLISNYKEVEEYAKLIKSKTEIERTDAKKEKTGIELKGIKARNPANKEEIPIWIADYILLDYGTGAIMAVPAHDERDFQFARKYNLPNKQVIEPIIGPIISTSTDASTEYLEYKKKVSEGNFPFTGYGRLINSGKFNGKISNDAAKLITEFVGGKWTVKYKLKDWVFSRQRYWGEPIPMLHGPDGELMALSEKDLPLKLPKVKYYEPTGTGESPLAAITKWVNVKIGKKNYKRETNTMPQWAGSSWYYLRYMDPQNNKKMVDPKKEKYWLGPPKPGEGGGVDLYVGGAEHATRHLIYARFWHKFLYDIGVVSTIEPFKKLRPVGLILAEDGKKMSKRWENVINPDDIIKKFGADTLRVYEMFMGPFDQSIAWSSDSMIGARRFVERVWKLQAKIQKITRLDNETQKSDVERLLHKTIKKVGDDIIQMRFNTAISSLMILLNAFEDENIILQSHFENFLLLLAPFAPHISEELWRKTGHKNSVHRQMWPTFEQKFLEELEITIAVQINGKTRGTLNIQKTEDENEIRRMAEDLPNVKKWLNRGKIKRIVYVKGRIINILVDEDK